MTDEAPDATIKLDKLGGTLRKRPVSGDADLKVHPGYVVEGNLSLASGKSRVEIAGSRGTDETNATIKLAIASLADWVPDASGSLDGNFHVKGHWPKLAVTGTAHGASVATGSTSIAVVDVDANVTSIEPPEGTATVRAQKVTSGNLAFETVDIEGGGSQKAHQLKVIANGTPLTTTIALDGAMGDKNTWSGTLSTLDIAVKDVPKLALQQPSKLAWDGKQFSATDVCLVGGGPTLCVAGSGGGDGAFAARYRIEALPLALIMKIASPDAPLRVDGMIAGHGNIRRDAAGAFNGQATIGSDKGNIAYPDNATQPLLAYTGLALDANLSPQLVHATVKGALDHDGRIDGEVTLSGPMRANPALSGKLDARLNSLAFVELLTPEVANMKGHAEAHWTFAGTTSAPGCGLARAEGIRDRSAERRPETPRRRDHGQGIRSRALRARRHDQVGRRHADARGFRRDRQNRAREGVDQGHEFPRRRHSGRARADLARSLDRAHDRRRRVGGGVTIPKANIDLGKLPGGGVTQNPPTSSSSTPSSRRQTGRCRSSSR